MKVLITFAGSNDPYASSQVANQGAARHGPILTLAAQREFDEVHILATTMMLESAEITARELEAIQPRARVNVRKFVVRDPTCHREIICELRGAFRDISSSHEQGVEYFMASASGTPQMAMCIALLVASNEIPARILQARPPAFVTADMEPVVEVDLRDPEFPMITHRPAPLLTPREHAANDPNPVLRALKIIGDDPAFLTALDRALAFSISDDAMLITGETGSGKELIARYTHEVSARAHGPFVAVNCSAIQGTLAESELFGHVKGAFTGAVADRKGKFESAQGGTLFLDEIGELSLENQARLLRAIQEKEISPVGSAKTIKVNVRFIAATNRDLKQSVADGGFRQDLYFRIAMLEVTSPPLRARRGDIIKMACAFLDKQNRIHKLKRTFAPETLAALMHYHWPGNIRELQGVVNRAYLLTRGLEITRDALEFVAPTSDDDRWIVPQPHPGFDLEAYISELRTQLKTRALELAGGNQSEAARLLNVSPNAISKWLKGLNNDEY